MRKTPRASFGAGATVRDLRPMQARRTAMVLAAAAVLLLAVAPARAVKTDVVALWNGDRITGEVKELQNGRLVYKTDDMGTINIEWLKVAELTSSSVFQVETSEASRFVGH